MVFLNFLHCNGNTFHYFYRLINSWNSISAISSIFDTGYWLVMVKTWTIQSCKCNEHNCMEEGTWPGGTDIGENRELKQTTTATATGTSPNKRFNEQNNGCARALWILVHFVAVLCQTTAWNDQVLRNLDNLGHDGKYFGFPYWIDRCHCIFRVSRFLDRFALRTGLVTYEIQE